MNTNSTNMEHEIDIGPKVKGSGTGPRVPAGDSSEELFKMNL